MSVGSTTNIPSTCKLIRLHNKGVQLTNPSVTEKLPLSFEQGSTVPLPIFSSYTSCKGFCISGS